MQGINIREIRTSDYNDIYLLNQELNPKLHQFSAEKVKERIDYILQNTKDIIFVSEQNDEVIGYIHGSPYELLFSDSLINVLGFVVKEKYRDNGVGSMLIGHLEDWVINNRFSGIKLLTHPSRVNAHRFYEQHGYIHTKDQKNYMKMFKLI
ncbi:MAG TPA: GNAT family N-acetyltransferase [Clostridia bacterium]|nr:GNAT family N-acetyltransferase [Clostridia bacterium]